MDYLDNCNVIYLEGKDIHNNSLLFKGKCMILIQSIGCGFCKKAKPDYSKASNQYKDFYWFTIEMDTADDKLTNFVKSLPGFSGYPHYVLFENGNLVETYNGNRSASDLINFVKNK